MSKITDNQKNAYQINDFSAFLYTGICKSLGLLALLFT